MAFKLTNTATGEVMFVESTDGHDLTGWTSEAVAEPTDQDSATAALDTQGVQAWALDQIEADAQAMSAAQFPRLRRQIATVMLWNEVQRLKLANATGNFTGLSATEKAHQFPTLAALAQQSGNSIAAVATAVETRLWDRVRRMALAEAKLLLGRNDVRSAVTSADKIAALNAIVWSE